MLSAVFISGLAGSGVVSGDGSGVVSGGGSGVVAGGVSVAFGVVSVGALVGFGAFVGFGVGVSVGTGVGVGDGFSVGTGVGVAVTVGVGEFVGSAVVDLPDVSSEEVDLIEEVSEVDCEAEVSLEESLQEANKRGLLSSKDKTSNKAICLVFLITGHSTIVYDVYICILCLYQGIGKCNHMRSSYTFMGISSRERIPNDRIICFLNCNLILSFCLSNRILCRKSVIRSYHFVRQIGSFVEKTRYDPITLLVR